LPLTPNELDELLGPWALDVLDDDERALVDAALAAEPELARRAARLQQVVALLGESAAAPPPPELRDALLASAAAAPPEPPAATEPVALFANQVDAMADVLAALDGALWDRPVEPYPWTALELAGHIAVIDRYTAHQLGIAPWWTNAGPSGHLEMGAAEIAAVHDHEPAVTVARWQEAASATVTALRSGHGPALDTSVELHGWPLTVAGALTARSFELWTHADDIRRAAGWPLLPPSPADLRAMSQLSVTTLPLLAPVVAPDVVFKGARVVLTGEGGGTYDLGDPGERQVVLVADVIDYCHVVARRADPASLASMAEGDPRTADQLLAAARFFAL
jgi:hypothetical protein